MPPRELIKLYFPRSSGVLTWNLMVWFQHCGKRDHLKNLTFAKFFQILLTVSYSFVGLFISSSLPPSSPSSLSSRSTTSWTGVLSSVSRSCTEFNTVWHSQVPYSKGNAVQCNATVQYSTEQYSTVQYSAMQRYSTVLNNTVQCSTVQFSKVLYNKVLYSTIQYNEVEYISAQCSAVQ